MSDYIFEMDGRFYKVPAFSRSQAYQLAKMYGYKGLEKDIRRF